MQDTTWKTTRGKSLKSSINSIAAAMSLTPNRSTTYKASEYGK